MIPSSREGRTRWDLVGTGFGLQCLIVAILVILPMLMPEKLEAVKRYWVTPIEGPPVVAWKPKPPPPPATENPYKAHNCRQRDPETGGNRSAEAEDLQPCVRFASGETSDRTKEHSGTRHDGSGEGVP